MAGRGPIHVEATVGTKDAKDALDDLSRHARKSSEGVASLFKQEPMGERRMRGTLESVTRMLTDTGTAGEKAAGAIELLASRLSLGAGVGAGIAIAAVGVNRLAQYGEDLRKRYSEIGKEAHQAGREARLTDAAEGLDAVTEKAIKARHRIREASDEVRKSVRQSFVREAAENTAAAFSHPIQALKNIFEIGGEEQPGAKRRRERLETGSKAQREAQQQLSQYSKQREEALGLEVDLEDKLLHGSEEEIANEKILTSARLEQMKIESLRLPNEAKLNQLLQQKVARQLELSHREQQSRNAELESALRLGQIESSNLTTREKSVAAAYEGLRAAKEQEALAQSRGPEARAEARIKTVEAARGAVSAEEAVLVKEGEEEAMTPKEQQSQYQQRLRQMEGLRHAFARRGIRSDLIPPPKLGEAEYDPLAQWRGMRQRELAQPQEVPQEGQGPMSLQQATKALEQDERRNPILTLMKGDVESIKDDIHSLATRSSGGSPGGGGRGGGGSVPTQGAGGNAPMPQLPELPTDGGAAPQAADDTEQNQQAYENYWSRPDVQAGMQGQADVGAEAAAAHEQGMPPFSSSSAREPLPHDDSWMRGQMSRAPFLPGYEDYKNRPMLPIDDNTDFSKWRDIQPPPINPQAGGNIGDQGQGMDQSGFEKIVNKMTQVWG
jgi:hypothetical protein